MFLNSLTFVMIFKILGRKVIPLLTLKYFLVFCTFKLFVYRFVPAIVRYNLDVENTKFVKNE